MVKYFIPRKQIRFTVFTQDKSNSDADSQMYGTDNRRRKFVFKLSSSEQMNGNKTRISIESVKCRDMSNIFQGLDHDANAQTLIGSVEGLNRATQRAIGMGNADEMELYTIRAEFVSTTHVLDTRPQQYKTGGIIYNGSLNFQNTNPHVTYCYDVSENILNNDITLYIDSNYHSNNVDELGIKNDLEVAITFILWDGDEVDAIDGYRPEFNSIHISNRDRV